MDGSAREHGAGLVERVIDAIRADAGRSGRATPMAPDVVGAVMLPSGRTLSPSLRRWLEYDTSLLAGAGWLASTKDRRLTPRPLDDIATAEWGGDWGGLYAPLAWQLA